MGLITPNDFDSLRELYTAQLRYLLSTENQIVKGLPDMIEHSDDQQRRRVSHNRPHRPLHADGDPPAVRAGARGRHLPAARGGGGW